MPANYDKIATVYDLLSRIVFGKSIVNAQVSLLKCLPAGEYRLLIVGGGTGWILEELAKQRPQGLTIDYVEASAKMIELSKNRGCATNTVNFICLPIESFESGHLYNVIITPFVLDNFDEQKLEQVFYKLDALVADGGTWLYADFVYSKETSPGWQKLLLKIMYFFFRISTKIETGELVATEKLFEKSYRKKMEAGFYFNFIKAIAYKKL